MKQFEAVIERQLNNLKVNENVDLNLLEEDVDDDVPTTLVPHDQPSENSMIQVVNIASTQNCKLITNNLH